MSKQHIALIIAEASQPDEHGKWSRFCVAHGLTRDAVYHWRKKLGLPLKAARQRGE